MAIDFPTATTVGQTYTDPTSGNTYVVTVVGPPAQWVGSGSSTSLDNTYLRKDASNDPVTGTLTVTPSTNVEGLVVTQPSGNSAAAMRITNEGTGNSLVVEDSANPDSTPIVADSSGRLLVGATTARSNFYNGSTINGLLQLEGTTDLTRAITSTHNAASAAGPLLIFAKSRGATVGSNTIVQNGDQTGEIAFQGSDGTEFVTAAYIRGNIDGTPGANDMPGVLTFGTTADGASDATERMRISSNGNVTIGSTTRAATLEVQSNGGTPFASIHNLSTGQSLFSIGIIAASTTWLHFNGTSSNNTVQNILIYGNGDIRNANNSYGAISDIKLKENIVDSTSQWNDLRALQVRKYNFKEETGQETHTQIGLIAQEVELVCPSLVSERPDRDKDGNDLGTVTKSVNYSVLYMKAVKALQEAMERIEQLEAAVTALQQS